MPRSEGGPRRVDYPNVDVTSAASAPPDPERLETLGLLSAGLAHEISSPLQAITHNLRYLQEGLTLLEYAFVAGEAVLRADAGTQAEALRGWQEARVRAAATHPIEELVAAVEDSVEATQRAAAIVRALAEFAQGELTLETTVDINALVDSVVTLTRNAWKYIAEVDLVLAPSLPPVRTSPGRTRLACARFMLDAARDIAERQGGAPVSPGRILVETALRGSHVDVVVTAESMSHVLGVPVAA